MGYHQVSSIDQKKNPFEIGGDSVDGHRDVCSMIAHWSIGVGLPAHEDRHLVRHVRQQHSTHFLLPILWLLYSMIPVISQTWIHPCEFPETTSTRPLLPPLSTHWHAVITTFSATSSFWPLATSSGVRGGTSRPQLSCSHTPQYPHGCHRVPWEKNRQPSETATIRCWFTAPPAPRSPLRNVRDLSLCTEVRDGDRVYRVDARLQAREKSRAIEARRGRRLT
jgi:hypothetical protein